MERMAFETELHQQGYAVVVDRRMEPNAVNLEHTHEFDARLLVLDGTMTVTAAGTERTYNAGDTFTMSADCRHSERSGSMGVRYLAGRRYPAVR